MFYVTGDTHGLNDINKLYKLSCVDTDDYLIICGDVGMFWTGADHDKEVISTLLGAVSCNILWIDGNHENFDLIDALSVDWWKGGNVHRIHDRIIHLMRGEVYDIDGKTFFCFGGGQSIDRVYRTKGESWWPQEMPSQNEYRNGLNNLARYENKIDYVITHTAPRFICKQLVSEMYPGEEQLQNYLSLVSERVKFKKWFFGHWHKDKIIDNYYALYNNIEQIG